LHRATLKQSILHKNVILSHPTDEFQLEATLSCPSKMTVISFQGLFETSVHVDASHDGPSSADRTSESEDGEGVQSAYDVESAPEKIQQALSGRGRRRKSA
jgi:hypothetical protein